MQIHGSSIYTQVSDHNSPSTGFPGATLSSECNHSSILINSLRLVSDDKNSLDDGKERMIGG